jgi:hypothetical protein
MPNPAGGTMTGRTGDGYIRLTFTPPVSTSVSLSMASSNISKGTNAQATVTVTQAGKITFLANGKRIQGCISRAITTTYTCTWKVSNRSVLNITAILYPTSGAYLTSYSAPVALSSTSRSTTR